MPAVSLPSTRRHRLHGFHGVVQGSARSGGVYLNPGDVSRGPGSCAYPSRQGGHLHHGVADNHTVNPSSGPTAGGNSVVITGTNFTGATVVKFGTVDATSYVVNSATQITAVAPAGAAGTIVDVTVTTPAGTNSIAGTGNDYTYGPPATAPAPSC